MSSTVCFFFVFFGCPFIRKAKIKARGRAACLCNTAGIKETASWQYQDVSWPTVESAAQRCLVLKSLLSMKGGMGGEVRRGGVTALTATVEDPRGENSYSRRAPLNLFERPLRHLRAGSSIARSGPPPALNPLPAARDGWRQIPVLRPPLSKRDGGRGGRGEMEG